MHVSDIESIVLNWFNQRISNDFGKEHLKKDIALLGLDSIDVVEFCKYLETKFGIEVDYDCVMEFETLNDLSARIKAISAN